MPAVVRALVALSFFVIGVIHLRGYLRSARRPGTAGCRAAQVDQVAHALMNVEMTAMVWPLPVPDRWGAQAAVFAVITGWFTVRAVSGRLIQIQHALTAAAMTGMLTFPLVATAPTYAPAAGTVMSGMPMPGPTPGASGVHLGALTGGCLLVSAAWSVLLAYRAGRRVTAARSGWRDAAGPVADALVHAAMAAGMAAILLSRS